MGNYVRRVQTVLTEEEYRDLSRLSEETRKPLSVLIREAIEEVHLQPAIRERRRAALKNLLALEAPVSDWQEMEQEIIAGAAEE